MAVGGDIGRCRRLRSSSSHSVHSATFISMFSVHNASSHIIFFALHLFVVRAMTRTACVSERVSMTMTMIEYEGNYLCIVSVDLILTHLINFAFFSFVAAPFC